MKLVKTIALVLVLFVFNGIASAASNSPAEENAIKQAVTDYVQSIDTRNTDEFSKVVSDEASFVGYNSFTKKVTYLDASKVVDNLKTNRMGGWTRNVEVSSVDLSGNTAMAKIVITDSRIKQSEYISLIKDGDNWKIVSSTSYLEKNSNS